MILFKSLVPVMRAFSRSDFIWRLFCLQASLFLFKLELAITIYFYNLERNQHTNQYYLLCLVRSFEPLLHRKEICMKREFDVISHFIFLYIPHHVGQISQAWFRNQARRHSTEIFGWFSWIDHHVILNVRLVWWYFLWISRFCTRLFDVKTWKGYLVIGERGKVRRLPDDAREEIRLTDHSHLQFEERYK